MLRVHTSRGIYQGQPGTMFTITSTKERIAANIFVNDDGVTELVFPDFEAITLSDIKLFGEVISEKDSFIKRRVTEGKSLSRSREMANIMFGRRNVGRSVPRTQENPLKESNDDKPEDSAR